MKIIYSNKHSGHAPTHQLFGDGLHPAVEVPDRAKRILQTLHLSRVSIVGKDIRSIYHSLLGAMMTHIWRH